MMASPTFSFATGWQIALPLGGPVPGGASIREHAVAWHPDRERFYLVGDVILLGNPHHPNTYDTELHLWSSPDLTLWQYHGVAVPKGVPEQDYDGYGVASPAGMVFAGGRLWVPFSARRTSGFAKRPIGLSWSGIDPEVLPWTKSPSPIDDVPESEDDDPALVVLPGDPRLHLYHRSTVGGYHIRHTATATPHQPWPASHPVTSRPPGVRAQELTGAIATDGHIHLFVIEQGEAVRGTAIAHLIAREPNGPFLPADPNQRHLVSQPTGLAYGGHFTPVTRDHQLVAAFWTVNQDLPRYGLQGHRVRAPRLADSLSAS